MIRNGPIFATIALLVLCRQPTAFAEQPPVPEFDGNVAQKVIDKGIDKLLFVKRRTSQQSHYYTSFIDGCVHYGGNICILDLRTGKVKELLPERWQSEFASWATLMYAELPGSSKN